MAGAFRAIPFKILIVRRAGPAARSWRSSRNKPRGLVLVTGPTGSGKSTTLAAIIDKINSEARQHIMTMEDPIEYLHPHKKCVVNQREIGSDTKSFKTRSSTCCARIRTSCSSAKCAISRRSKRR